MKKINLVLYSTSPGGLEVKLLDLIKRLQSYNFSLFSLRPVDKQLPDIFDATGVLINEGSKYNPVLFYKYFIFALKNRNEIFHHFNSGPVILWLTKMAGVKKIVYSIHGTIYWNNFIEKMYLKFFWRLAACRAIIFTTNSVYSKKIFLNDISKKVDPIVIYNSFDLEKFTYKKKMSRPSLLKVCYIGRLAKGKNLPLWVNVAEFLINNSNHVFQFSIYGIGPIEDELRKLIDKKNLKEYIQIMGFTDKPEDVFHSYDLLIFLSEYESFGNVVVESILCGTPVIASDIPSHNEIFNSRKDFLVPLNSETKNMILEKINNYEGLLKKTDELQKEFAKRFSAKNQLEIQSAIYGFDTRL